MFESNKLEEKLVTKLASSATEVLVTKDKLLVALATQWRAVTIISSPE